MDIGADRKHQDMYVLGDELSYPQIPVAFI
jgi:hypothetical protein